MRRDYQSAHDKLAREAMSIAALLGSGLFGLDFVESHEGQFFFLEANSNFFFEKDKAFLVAEYIAQRYLL